MTKLNPKTLSIVGRWLRFHSNQEKITTLKLYETLGNFAVFGVGHSVFHEHLRGFVKSGELPGFTIKRGAGLVRVRQLSLPFDDSENISFSKKDISKFLKVLRRGLVYQRLQLNRRITQLDELMGIIK